MTNVMLALDAEIERLRARERKTMAWLTEVVTHKVQDHAEEAAELLEKLLPEHPTDWPLYERLERR
jgi:putative protein kinase ArgK-like GTPase of G3E family